MSPNINVFLLIPSICYHWICIVRSDCVMWPSGRLRDLSNWWFCWSSQRWGRSAFENVFFRWWGNSGGVVVPRCWQSQRKDLIWKITFVSKRFPVESLPPVSLKLSSLLCFSSIQLIRRHIQASNQNWFWTIQIKCLCSWNVESNKLCTNRFSSRKGKWFQTLLCALRFERKRGIAF